MAVARVCLRADVSLLNLSVATAFTELFVKRPVLSVAVSLLILLIGLRAATVLPIRQYPKLSNTVVNITTSYPGASADMIQGFITTPLEQAVASAEGVDYTTSSSVLGTSTIQVYIKLNFDPNEALTEVLSKVNSVRYLIPKESNDPVVAKSTGQTTAVMYIGFSSEELTASAISDYLSRMVQPVLSTVDGVAAVDILGGQSFAMRLWLDPARMSGHGVSPADVSAAIAANNFQAAAGQAKGYFIVSDVTANTDLRSVDDFESMVVKANDDGFVRIEDIATVELAAQTADVSVAMNGEHAIFIGVQASPQGNPLNIVRGVRALFPEMERNMPPSVKMKVAYDSPNSFNRRLMRWERRSLSPSRSLCRDLSVPRLAAVGHHSRRHHAAVARWCLQHDAGTWLFIKSPDPPWCLRSAWSSTTRSSWWRTFIAIWKQARRPRRPLGKGRARSSAPSFR